MITVKLTAQNRTEELEIDQKVKLIELKVSRKQCKDVLLEVIDEQGNAKGKPLEKYLPCIKQKGVKGLRFMMNDFSTKPIEISISWK
ncbi:hypothetical protein [Carboxylicivirga sp. M1479]|uniref:hypothetical protein n=1 Tax=Carboxylicivirga sp. M1479 TaxID=2594476 RepID=UPI001177CECF|nr:hypothetical protein [Carboxylicivirga sp. M1479]TRX70450.1 hypothetical protein FNN09_10750 [Carboxylicivirga sp. M1479]